MTDHITCPHCRRPVTIRLDIQNGKVITAGLGRLDPQSAPAPVSTRTRRWLGALIRPAPQPSRRAPTARQAQVIELLLGGCNSNQIAHHLGISKRAVDKHIQDLKIKYQAATLAQLGYKLGSESLVSEQVIRRQ